MTFDTIDQVLPGRKKLILDRGKGRRHLFFASPYDLLASECRIDRYVTGDGLGFVMIRVGLPELAKAVLDEAEMRSERHPLRCVTDISEWIAGNQMQDSMIGRQLEHVELSMQLRESAAAPGAVRSRSPLASLSAGRRFLIA